MKKITLKRCKESGYFKTPIKGMNMASETPSMTYLVLRYMKKAYDIIGFMWIGKLGLGRIQQVLNEE